jgi:putative integral membrane protein (TIGR02587 family)
VWRGADAARCRDDAPDGSPRPEGAAHELPGRAGVRTSSSTPSPTAAASRPAPSRRFWKGVARAVGGAVVFSIPLYMTMEMWQLGFAAERGRIALLAALSYPLLVGLSHVSGFEATLRLREDVVDAAVAWAVGVSTGACGLLVLGVLGPGQSASEMVGKLTIQAVPGSIGALLAHSQFGDDDDGEANAPRAVDANRDGRPDSYWSQLVVMAAGALYLTFNVAPTEEMPLIAYRITAWHALVLVALTVGAMHAFVYGIDIAGREAAPPGTPAWSVFVRFTVVGYAIALAISAYVLWTFGRLDDTGAAESIASVVVLALPAAIGAAAARLLL